MAGLVFGGLIYRGGLVSMLIAAAIDGGFGLPLATPDHERCAGCSGSSARRMSTRSTARSASPGSR
jgi:hypothetical protein